MLEFMFAGVMVVAAVFAMMARINLRRFLGYNNWVDVLFTVLMVFLFHGTFSGIVSASVSGVVMSAALYVARALIGYERLVKTSTIYGIPQMAWVRFPPQRPKLKDRKIIQWIITHSREAAR